MTWMNTLFSKTVRWLHQIVAHILHFPASPRGYVAAVSILRSLRILRKPSEKCNQSFQRIFISHPYPRVGDLVLLLPLLETIRSHWANASIDIAIGANVADLLLGVRGLGRVFIFSPSRSKVQIKNRYFRFINTYLRVFDGLIFYRREVMRNHYDIAIVPRWGSNETYEATYLAYLTGAHERYGYSAQVDQGNPAIDALFTRVANGGAHEQEALRNVRLLSRLGLVVETAEDARVVDHPIQSLVNLARIGEKQLDRVLDHRTVHGKYVVISPGATARFRAWPAECLGDVMEMLHRKFSFAFYIVGDENDVALCRDLVRKLPDCAFSLAGKTSLKQLTSLTSKADLFLGNDTGTAHIAGGLGVPTVVVSPFPLSCEEEHYNSPVRFRPCGPWVRVVQPARPLAPCHPTCAFHEAHCIRQVSAKEVFAAAVALLGSRKQLRSQPGLSTDAPTTLKEPSSG